MLHHYSPAPAASKPSITENADAVAMIELLIAKGNKRDAYKTAVANNIWGHAFVLASRLGADTFNEAIVRLVFISMTFVLFL